MIASTSSFSLNLSIDHQSTITEHFAAAHLPSNISISDALHAYKNGQFQLLSDNIANFGIDSPPMWLAITLRNPTKMAINKQLIIANSWLDKLEISVHHQQGDMRHFSRGDHFAFDQRHNNQRFFTVDFAFQPGISYLLIRVESVDPMVLPIYLAEQSDFNSQLLFDSYSYGFLYGAIFCLLAYNFMLAVGLRSITYFYYSLFLLSFLILNISYSGHGFQWLWPHSPQWQQWANPLLMVIFNICGLLFALRFLEIRRLNLSIYRCVIALCICLLLTVLGALILDQQGISLLAAFGFMLLFSLIMLFLGGIAVAASNANGKLFLLASISSMLGTATTGLAVWGMIPYTNMTFRAGEVGMVIDITLLALALARKFRTIENEKQHAQYMAKIDPLTGLNNRRAFYELMPAIWQSTTNKRNLTLALIDLDYFKQINDTYGHVCGDQVLNKVGSILMQNLREKDIAVRWGGEEFLIVYHHATLSQAEILASELAKQIASYPFAKGEQRFTITASIGLAEGCSECHTLGQLIDKADNKLYQAKHEGRNQIRC
ncbi:sensor domain-containing diguanylate cyclase [Shewanella colwelliana]|uniref:sensor domain-containing diguanylate cyclase n=1 Tax=Shewanella colwelliana TaxID=23 RepID=UPI0037350CD1